MLEAEKQRKAAETERKRRQEEAEHQQRLERAKQLREEEEKRRKEQEQLYQGRLAKIEDEMKALEATKAEFITEKLNLAKDLNLEESGLKSEMDGILRQKAEIMDKEQGARRKMENFQDKARRERVALDQRENDANGRLRQLTQERRQVQTEMLTFLQQPLQSMTVAEPQTNYNSSGPSAPSYPTNTTPGGVLGGPGINGPAPATNPAINSFPPQPNQGGYPGVPINPPYMLPPAGGQLQPQPGYPQNSSAAPTPTYPTYPTNTPPNQPGNTTNMGANPSVEIVGTSKVDALREQINLLDDLLQQGVLSKDEYNANRKEALQAAGETEASFNQGQNKSEVDKQLAQLDQYLKDGILTQTDYEDAKNRVLRDAGLLADGGDNNNSGGNVPFAQIAPASSGNVKVMVTCPADKRAGQEMLINYNGKLFNVKIPGGVVPGQQFEVQVPA